MGTKEFINKITGGMKSKKDKATSVAKKLKKKVKGKKGGSGGNKGNKKESFYFYSPILGLQKVTGKRNSYL